ncbi:helix-turn-helix domain-containing protein [Nocardioides sp. YIM 152315]|uniref:helix-turn-helix domain-containing protein n=1 Tax=Nocardioides sp. YIM 152315 TaxID=3031760 RepID=UPI0023DCE4F6|nr:helix-turn-helix domain-containing protein [Nocardioides sp. YIM 152315]MDF1603358.1 helix-turn-helix domain-containing protein [Nocardioides sp. YIM 152315]
MSTALPRLAYTRKEAAEMCGVSEDTLRRAKNRGALKAKRLTEDEERKGGKELYTRAALEAWLEGLADA